MATKALGLLSKRKQLTERAAQYAERIAKSLEITLINPLVEQIEKLEDKVFDLENFSLDTDLNKGLRQMTKEDAEARFKEIIEVNYQIDLLTAKLESYSKSFEKYFGEETEEAE